MQNSRWTMLVCVLVLAVAAGCQGDDEGMNNGAGLDAGDDVDDMTMGQRLYEQPHDEGNTFACATCHALDEPAADGLRRPGHAIGNATRRPSYKNGQLTEMRLAVNSCLEEWMGADAWPADDERWAALYDYLDAQATVETAPALEYTIVEPPQDMSGGDADTGAQIFADSCAVCHGPEGRGTERAISVAGRGLDPDYVAQRVRTSGTEDSAVYEGLTGGRMPFWAEDRLSDQELRHIGAFLAQEQTTEDAGMDAGQDVAEDTSTDDGSTEDVSSGCDATHEKVGWTTELSNRFHDVGGSAEIVDNCTIRVTNFTYDAQGIDVRFYGAQGTDFDNGFPISDDLVRGEPYNGETLTITFDPSRLDELDSISVWCVDVGVDFGSGTFTAP